MKDVGQLLAGAGIADAPAMKSHSERFDALERLQARSAGKARGASEVLERSRALVLFAELEERLGVQLTPRWEDVRG